MNAEASLIGWYRAEEGFATRPAGGNLAVLAPDCVAERVLCLVHYCLSHLSLVWGLQRSSTSAQIAASGRRRTMLQDRFPTCLFCV